MAVQETGSFSETELDAGDGNDNFVNMSGNGRGDVGGKLS